MRTCTESEHKLHRSESGLTQENGWECHQPNTCCVSLVCADRFVCVISFNRPNNPRRQIAVGEDSTEIKLVRHSFKRTIGKEKILEKTNRMK